MFHIGIDARLTHYRVGGISTYIRRLVTALEAIDYDHHYTVFHSRKMREPISVRFAREAVWTPAHHRFERLALSLELARFRLDLLHSPDFIPPLRAARRHVITVHDLTFLHYPEYVTADARRFYNDQINWAAQHADHILTDSEASKRDLIAMLGVPEHKLTVHRLGVDEQFRPLADENLSHYRRQLELQPGYLLFVGTFEPRKNIPGLLEAYRLLSERLPNVPPLVLAGTRGWLFDETMALIERMQMHNHVLWREAIPQSTMPALYCMARALVTPSFYEGFGLPALEAMACGTPPIVSNRSSLPEVVGDVGLLVDPDDPADIAAALERAVSDDSWHAEQREIGLQRAATFTWAETARTALGVYQAVL